MKKAFQSLLVLMIMALSACSSNNAETEELIEKKLNEIMAAKSPYAVGKYETPLLSTYSWDSIFGGPAGDTLQYDRFGEIDQLVFVAPPETVFSLQRQVRVKTRSGGETIYYKVSTPFYKGEEALWADGRFLDLQDIEPKTSSETLSSSEILKNLRSFKGSPYTWHGSSSSGAEQLLEWYPPSKPLSERSKNDWIVKGFDSIGMLFRASKGTTPLTFHELSTFGSELNIDFSAVNTTDSAGNIKDSSLEKAKMLMNALSPLDMIVFSDRVLIVLDGQEVIESRYRSKFDGEVKISPLFDTIVGLLQKAVFVVDPAQELDPKQKSFFIRRFADQIPNPEEEELSEDIPETSSSALNNAEIIE